MKIKTLSICAVAVAMLAASCSTPKNITYFQDIVPGSVVDPAVELAIKVKPEDKLSIMVSTQDPALSSLFNLVTTQNRVGGTTSSTRGVATANSGNGNTAYYTVDEAGYINFPVIGKLHIAGLTRAEVAEFVENKLKSNDLVKDPIVTVEFANTGLTVLGEVSSPGRYEFNKDRLSIIDAIGMAGDLTPNGLRENVMVLRETEPGKHLAYRLDLTDMSQMAASPAFYLQQNDVIYVEPTDKKKRDATANGNTPFTPAFWMSVGSFGITIATLIITLTK